MKDSHLIISKRGLLLCFASLSVLCGCTHSELSEEGDGATAPLCVCQAWTGGLVTDTDTDDSAITRAEGASTELTSGAIGLFLKANALEGYENAITNQKYTYGTPSWQPLANEKPLQLTKKLAKMAAYYPYLEGQQDTVKQLVCDRDPYNETTDTKMFYYKNFTASMYNASVNLDLRRPYSLLRFIVSKDKRYAKEGMVTTFRWKAPGLTTSGYLNLLEGKVILPKLGNQGGTISQSFLVKNVDDPDPYKIEYLVVPSQFTGPLTVDVIADDNGAYPQASVTATELCGPEGKFVEGMVYEIRVTLRPGKLTVQAITVTPWVDGGVSGKDLENK